ncbi:MAG: I78 family peptidase inhibitor [Rhodoblastus sp.]
MRRFATATFLCLAGAPAMACEAGRASFVLGKTYSSELAEEARVAAGAASVRRMIAGRPYTMEFFGMRLNLHTDAQRVIQRITCG